MRVIVLLFGVCLVSACNSSNLGGGIYLLEGDRIEDRIVVRCRGKSFNDCVTGDYLIPRSYHDQFDSNGHYSQYVKEVKSNSAYIIATTILVKTREKRYWIILKTNKPQEVIGPLDKTTFNVELKKNKINLRFFDVSPAAQDFRF